MSDTYAYYLEDKMYLNLTNLCTNNCIFCIRSLNETVAGSDLTLNSESVSVEEVISQIKQKMQSKTKEIVFCGYGEPILRLEKIKPIAKFIKENYPNIPTRINTNGQGNIIFKRNIVPELVGLIDSVSISLNSDNAEQYQELSQSKFGEESYEGVKEFIKLCAEAGIDTTATIVTGYKDTIINVENCEKIATELGAKLRIREWLDDGYN